MTRREKELFAMAIRYADRQITVPHDAGAADRMSQVARRLAQNLTFEVTDDEITAAVAVNIAGKGERTAVPADNPRDALYHAMKDLGDE